MEGSLVSTNKLDMAGTDVGKGPESESTAQCSHYSNFELYTLVWLGSVVGSMLRVTVWTAAEDGMFDLHRTLYANFIGCIIMGVLTQLKGWLVARYYSIYLGVGVGLCKFEIEKEKRKCCYDLFIWSTQGTQGGLNEFESIFSAELI